MLSSTTNSTTKHSNTNQYSKRSRIIGGSILIICVIASALVIFTDESRMKMGFNNSSDTNDDEANVMNYIQNSDDMPLMIELREDHETTLGNSLGSKSLNWINKNNKCWKIVRERCFLAGNHHHCDYFDGKFFKPDGLEEDNGGDDHAQCVDVNGDGRCDYSTETVEGCHNTCLVKVKSWLSATMKCGAYLQSKSNNKKECYCVLGEVGNSCCASNQPCSGASSDGSGAIY